MSGAQSPPLGSNVGRVSLLKAAPTRSQFTKSKERTMGML